MRKKVVYLGIGFVILGVILAFMGLFILSDTGFYLLSGNSGALSTIILVRSIMNWLGIIFSVGGAVAIIAGVYLDEQVQFEKVDSTNQQSGEKEFTAVDTPQQSDKTGYCFQCGAKLEGTPKYCFECGTKLR